MLPYFSLRKIRQKQYRFIPPPAPIVPIVVRSMVILEEGQIKRKSSIPAMVIPSHMRFDLISINLLPGTPDFQRDQDFSVAIKLYPTGEEVVEHSKVISQLAKESKRGFFVFGANDTLSFIHPGYKGAYSPLLVWNEIIYDFVIK